MDSSTKIHGKILVAILVFGLALAISAQPLCKIESKANSCLDAVSGDTVWVDNNTLLFGSKISFCPDTVYKGVGTAQIILCIDRSWSMRNTDPDVKTVDVAKSFVDAVSALSPGSEIGIVLYSAGGTYQNTSSFTRSKATGVEPVTIDSKENLDVLYATIDSAANRGTIGAPHATPYGAALDTCLAYFARMEDDSNRIVIFLSDGEPWVLGSGNDPGYVDLLTSGRVNDLPPVYTVYFHTGDGQQEARDTLINLADMTGGTFTDVAGAEALYTVYLDSLLSKTIPILKVQNFQLTNETTGSVAVGQATAASPTHVVASFDPLILVDGENSILFQYESALDGGGTRPTIEQFLVIKKLDALTDEEELALATAFEKLCALPSEVTILGPDGQEMPDGAPYDSTTDSIYIKIVRGPSDEEVQTITVTIVTASGDTEVVVVEEGATEEDIYEAILQIIGSPAVPYNDTLNVSDHDTIFVFYDNEDFQSSDGTSHDQSSDTIIIVGVGGDNGGGGDPDPPVSLNPLTSPAAASFGASVQSSGNGTVRFVVGLEEAGNLDLRVFELQGRKVWSYTSASAGQGRHSVVANTKLRGIYVLQLRSNGREFTQRFMVLGRR